MIKLQQVDNLENVEFAEIENELETPKCKVYMMRWWILLMSFMFSVSSIMHYSHYTIIADVVVNYYGVSHHVVNWSTLVYLLVCVILSIPSTFVPERWGLRVTVLLGSGLTCIGSWVKVASVVPDRFWVALLGQCIIAFAQMLLLPLPPKLAGIWFAAKEVSTACGIGITGMQIGLALGCIIPPLILHEMNSKNKIAKGLYTISLSYAVVCTIIFLIILIFFKRSPPTPPSIAQLKLEENHNFFKSMKMFICSRTNVFLVIAYGSSVGINLAVTTLLNQIILKHYPNAQRDAGWIGFLIVFFGAAGTIACGVILDKFGKFKHTILSISLMGAASMLAYTVAITSGLKFVYLISAVFGFSTSSMQVVGVELAAELSYPVPQVISAGILVTSSEACGIIFTYIYSYLFDFYGDIYANLMMFFIFVVEFVLLCTLKFDLRRQTLKKLETTTRRS